MSQGTSNALAGFDRLLRLVTAVSPLYFQQSSRNHLSKEHANALVLSLPCSHLPSPQKTGFGAPPLADASTSGVAPQAICDWGFRSESSHWSFWFPSRSSKAR